MIYNAKTYFSEGGFDANEHWSTSMLFKTGNTPSIDELQNLAYDIALLYGSMLTNVVIAQRVVFSPVSAPNTRKIARGDHIPFVTNRPGARAPKGSKELATADTCVVFEKDAGIGFAGRIFMRGALFADEVVTGANGEPKFAENVSVTPFTGFATQLPLTFTEHNCTLVLPARKDQVFNQDERVIRKVVFEGLSTRDRRVSRQSVTQATRAVALRELHAMSDTYYRSIKESVPPGTLSQGAHDELVKEAKVLNARFTYGTLVRAGIPPVLKSIFASATTP